MRHGEVAEISKMLNQGPWWNFREQWEVKLLLKFGFEQSIDGYLPSGLPVPEKEPVRSAEGEVSRQLG